MIGKDILAAIILAAIAHSSVLALDMSGSAITQDDATKKAVQRSSITVQQGETEMAQAGSATQNVATAPAMGHALTGMAVHNGQGRELGEVANILATKNGNIDAIVVKSGSVLGLRETAFMVPWDRARIASSQDGQAYVIVDVPADKLEAEFGLFAAAPTLATATGIGTGIMDAPSQG